MHAGPGPRRAAGAALIDVATAPAPASAGFALARAPQRQVGVNLGQPLRDVALLGRGQRRRDGRTGLGLGLISSASLTPPTSYTLIGTALLVPAARFAPGWCPCDRVHPRMEGWAERRQAHYFICRVSETRRVRTQRGAARPMTRDARLSALHRGDFRPGAALPSPALPPDPSSDAPRSQVVMPGGRCPGPPEPAVTSRGRRTPLPAPPTGSSLEDAPP